MIAKGGSRPKVGLALSGGGVRGLAHLGVLQVLEEAHVPISCIAGTSMGGIVAGTYAAGVPVDEIIDFAKRVGILDFASPEPGWRGLFGHAKLSQLLQDLLGDDEITFADLRIPISVVAADVERGELVVFNRGPLIPALLATSSFPIIFSPVHYQGRWLVDGGVLNNFPVDVARQMCADRVLGVVTPPSIRIPTHDVHQEEPLSLRSLFFFTHQSLDWKLPLLIAESSTDLTVNLVNRQRIELTPPDVLLRIDQTNVGTFATDKSAEVITTGRRAAMERLDAISRLYTRPLEPLWLRRMQHLGRRFRRAWRAFNTPDYPTYP